ncbi:SRPBCC domain-containing protein [Galbitalea soli]|uniref:Activator of Hsp90 ATPase homologue 1/2-like C-terminal domain-containing protein n=1 Tax=Galbitalea soli TaxID=1268042 RepID=A0A7C9TQM2_9MICO|nr:hypothetical protein [Galbitalea soli]NYJ31114.1 uncharacterized protein YndB with AHSA1/START domain [Galbitalea soli]
MPLEELRFSREYPFPRSIVWDALTDETLVEGWLARARIDARVGGDYVLDWYGDSAVRHTVGEIERLDAPGVLVIRTDGIGVLRFGLTALPALAPAEPRRTRLDLTLEVELEPRLSATTVAWWRTNLEALAELLRGRPVSWANWEAEWGGIWRAFRDEARAQPRR